MSSTNFGVYLFARSTYGVRRHLLLDDDEQVSDNQVGDIDLEDKNLAVNEVLSASEIEELIGEEE